MFKGLFDKIVNIFAPIGSSSGNTPLPEQKKHPLDGPIRAAEEKTFGPPSQQKQETISLEQNINVVPPVATLTVEKPNTVEIKETKIKRPIKTKKSKSSSKAVVRKPRKKEQ